jgi:hypothetical protein
MMYYDLKYKWPQSFVINLPYSFTVLSCSRNDHNMYSKNIYIFIFIFFIFLVLCCIVILNLRFHPLSGCLVSVYYYKVFGGYCVAAWLPRNVKLAKVISSVLPQLPYRREHVEGDSVSCDRE